jgi:hypothetical protein
MLCEEDKPVLFIQTYLFTFGVTSSGDWNAYAWDAVGDHMKETGSWVKL